VVKMWRAVLWVKPMNSRPAILLAISGRRRGEGGLVVEEGVSGEDVWLGLKFVSTIMVEGEVDVE
jgi:hypothetical protein